jgi:hypothetical protein
MFWRFEIIDFSIFITIFSTIIANITSAFILFLIGYLYTLKPKVKISKKIVKGITEFDNIPKIAYKFKIINTSRIFKARHFSVKLLAVKRIINEYEGNFTEHYFPIKVKYGALDEILPYISKRKLRKLRKKGNHYSFWYRIITLENISEKYKEYKHFRLCVQYKNILGREYIINQYFENSIESISIGNFTNDSNLERINPLSEKEKLLYSELLGNVNSVGYQGSASVPVTAFL